MTETANDSMTQVSKSVDVPYLQPVSLLFKTVEYETELLIITFTKVIPLYVCLREVE